MHAWWYGNNVKCANHSKTLGKSISQCLYERRSHVGHLVTQLVLKYWRAYLRRFQLSQEQKAASRKFNALVKNSSCQNARWTSLMPTWETTTLITSIHKQTLLRQLRLFALHPPVRHSASSMHMQCYVHGRCSSVQSELCDQGMLSVPLCTVLVTA